MARYDDAPGLRGNATTVVVGIVLMSLPKKNSEFSRNSTRTESVGCRATHRHVRAFYSLSTPSPEHTRRTSQLGSRKTAFPHTGPMQGIRPVGNTRFEQNTAFTSENDDENPISQTTSCSRMRPGQTESRSDRSRK